MVYIGIDLGGTGIKIGCLLFSLFWCGLGLLLVYGVQPLVAEIVSSIPKPES